MKLQPMHWVWQRERPEHHSGAVRLYRSLFADEDCFVRGPGQCHYRSQATTMEVFSGVVRPCGRSGCVCDRQPRSSSCFVFQQCFVNSSDPCCIAGSTPRRCELCFNEYMRAQQNDSGFFDETSWYLSETSNSGSDDSPQFFVEPKPKKTQVFDSRGECGKFGGQKILCLGCQASVVVCWFWGELLNSFARGNKNSKFLQ